MRFLCVTHPVRQSRIIFWLITQAFHREFYDMQNKFFLFKKILCLTIFTLNVVSVNLRLIFVTCRNSSFFAVCIIFCMIVNIFVCLLNTSLLWTVCPCFLFSLLRKKGFKIFVSSPHPRFKFGFRQGYILGIILWGGGGWPLKEKMKT